MIKVYAPKHTRVGPAHDSYSRATYTAEVDGKHIELTCCSLAGTRLEINGVLVSYKSYMNKGDQGNPIAEFEALVGRTVDEIEADYDYSEDPMGHPSQYE